MKKMLLFASAALLLAASCTPEDKPDVKDTLGLSPVICSVAAGGGDVELSITGNSAWTVELTEWSTEDTEWCVPNVTEGEGAFTLKLAVSPNNSITEERSVIIEVSSDTKSLQARLTQGTLELGEGEVLVIGLDGKGRVWSAYNLKDKGVFETDVQAATAAFQFNRSKAWPFDPSKNNGVFNGGAPAADGMVPVEGFVEACQSYSEPHRKYSEDDPTAAVDDEDAWDDANDPCPEGWRVPTSWEIIQTLGYTDAAAGFTEDQTHFNGVRINAGDYGFTVAGLVVGLGKVLPSDLTPQNITEKGGLFFPSTGWINSTGYTDRTWLVCLWGATSHNDGIAGLYLSNWLDYCDHWGWGDGHKEFATIVRCIKK